MKVHYIDREKVSIAFFPDTKRFFRVNNKAKNLIDDMLIGKSKQDIMHTFEISESLYQKYYDNIFKNTFSGNSNSLSRGVENELSRLVIHLTNDCNMRCKYCYANGGNYHSKRDVMDVEILDQILNVFFNRFNIISNVQFFGGEPLMNLPLLEYACHKLSDKAEERNYSIIFGIVTNGTLINSRFIDLVNKYRIQVTLSYDGNPVVNDMMRIMKDQTRSSSIILKNAKRLKDETGQPQTVEVTYNQHHVEQGVSITDCVKHIQTILPNTQVHLVPAGDIGNSDYSISDLHIFSDSIHEIVDQSIKTNGQNVPTYSLAQRIFFALENRDANIPFICDAGLGTLSVSTKGDVYPCFMFTDDQKMCYGNINDSHLFDSEQSITLQKKLSAFSIKDQNLECKDCFIKKLCNGCLGLNSFYSGDPFKLAPPICNMFRTMSEEVLVEYTMLHETQKRELVENYV